MRLFVCSLLSAEQQTFYTRHIGALIEAHGGLLRAIPPATAHITYAFLPRVDAVNDVADVVREVTAKQNSLEIVLGRPAVLYGGLATTA